MINSYKIGKQILNCQEFIGYRRGILFMLRALWHHQEVQGLHEFFHRNPHRHSIITMHPVFFSQLTRQFFYKNSSTSERFSLITRHFSVLENQFIDQAVQQLHLGSGIRLWSAQYKEQILAIDLVFRTSEFKEGLLTLGLKLDNKYIYHINFWLLFDKQNALYIGALQGSREGLSINKELTKLFWGCRPKNLIMHALRILAQCLSINKIYAVSNGGFYANNYLHQDRKLKTSLDDFWLESGGKLSDDQRFFILPVIEHRKTIEEVVSNKRNLYRKRFAVLDRIADDIVSNLTPFMKNYPTTKSLSD
jgi:uncharacterized protein VirK/YbjX